MNPCPCGWHGDRSDRCECPEERVKRYRARVSGPLADLEGHDRVGAEHLAEAIGYRAAGNA